MTDLHELTLYRAEGYSHGMRGCVVMGSLLMVWLTCVQSAGGDSNGPSNIPVDDYALYDEVVAKKFLTSDTRLVVVERMTVPRLLPDQEGPVAARQLDEQAYFAGGLPRDLIRDFVAVNQVPARLEGRFRFGVRYRFVSGTTMEEPEVRGGFPVHDRPARPVQASPVLDRLAFSRVGRTLRNDHALLYVENVRPDGTGAGFLVWFRRQARDWTIYDTEVVWTVREPSAEEAPLLAP